MSFGVNLVPNPKWHVFTIAAGIPSRASHRKIFSRLELGRPATLPITLHNDASRDRRLTYVYNSRGKLFSMGFADPTTLIKKNRTERTKGKDGLRMTTIQRRLRKLCADQPWLGSDRMSTDRRNTIFNFQLSSLEHFGRLRQGGTVLIGNYCWIRLRCIFFSLVRLDASPRNQNLWVPTPIPRHTYYLSTVFLRQNVHIWMGRSAGGACNDKLDLMEKPLRGISFHMHPNKKKKKKKKIAPARKKACRSQRHVERMLCPSSANPCAAHFLKQYTDLLTPIPKCHPHRSQLRHSLPTLWFFRTQKLAWKRNPCSMPLRLS